MAKKNKAQYDESAGEYRTLGKAGPLGVGQPGVELAKPAAVEWYEKRVVGYHKLEGKWVGKKNPRWVQREHDYELTAGLIIGAGALVLGWEVGQSIAHGLAGVDPLSWANDIADWIEGEQPKTDIATATVGGMIEAHLVELIGGSSSAPATSSTSSSSSTGSSSSSPPPSTGPAPPSQSKGYPWWLPDPIDPFPFL